MADFQETKRKQFYRQLKVVICPELASRGFLVDKKRVFHKSVFRDDLSAIQIVEFQLGIKNAVGKFTVNVGVFSKQLTPGDRPPVSDMPRTTDCLPAMWRRLGFFFDPPQSFLGAFFGRKKPERCDYWVETVG